MSPTANPRLPSSVSAPGAFPPLEPRRVRKDATAGRPSMATGRRPVAFGRESQSRESEEVALEQKPGAASRHAPIRRGGGGGGRGIVLAGTVAPDGETRARLSRGVFRHRREVRGGGRAHTPLR